MRISPSSDLPDDLAHPRGERVSLIGSLVTGSTLILILAGLVVFYLTVTP